MIKNLIAIRLRATFLGSMTGKDKNGNPNGQISAGRIVGYTLLYAFIALLFLFIIAASALGAGILFIPQGMADIYFGIFMTVSLTVIFIFSIFETKSELFDCKDNQLLLSLPIKTSFVIASRIVTVLIYNYIIEAMLIIPTAVVYLILGGNVWGLIGSLIVAVLVPLLATALASGVGYAVANIARRMKYKTLVTTLLSVLFMVVYFVVYFGMLGMGEDFEPTPESIEAMGQMLRPFGVIGQAQLLSPVPLLLLVLITAAVCFLAFYFINKNYIVIITETKEAGKRVYREKRLAKKSAVNAIARKEFSKIFSSAGYLLNGGSGIIFLVFTIVIVIAEGESLSAVVTALGLTDTPLALIVAPIAVSAIVASVAMIMYSTSTVSLEGKNFWIIKSIPVSAKDIIIGKTLPNIIISSLLGVVGGAIICFAVGFDIVCFIFYILTPVTASIAFSFMGTALNIAKPKLDFVNEMQVVKQSFPVFVSMMVGMLGAVALVMLAFVFIVIGHPILFLIITQVLLIGLAILFYLLATTVGARKLSQIQV